MKVRIKFTKKGNMKFVGHLDIMRYFQKAIRRSGIDIEYSKGYSPHQIMSFAAPLGIGLTSDGEYMDIQMNSHEEPTIMVDTLNQVMNREIKIISFQVLSDESKNAMSLVTAADYSIFLKEGYETMHRTDWKDKFTAFLQQKEISILKKTKRSEKEVDIRPFIYAGACECSEFNQLISAMPEVFVQPVRNRTEKAESAFSADEETYYLHLAAGSENNLKPELVMEAFCIYAGISYSPFAYQVNRMEVYGMKNGTDSSRAPLEFLL